MSYSKPSRSTLLAKTGWGDDTTTTSTTSTASSGSLWGSIGSAVGGVLNIFKPQPSAADLQAAINAQQPDLTPYLLLGGLGLVAYMIVKRNKKAAS